MKKRKEKGKLVTMV